MNGQLLIQTREDDAYDFDAAYFMTGAPQASDMQHYGSTVYDATFVPPLYPMTVYTRTTGHDNFAFQSYAYDQQAAYPAGDFGAPLADAPSFGPGATIPQVYQPQHYGWNAYWASVVGRIPIVDSQQQTGLLDLGTSSSTTGGAAAPIAKTSTSSQPPYDLSAPAPPAGTLGEDLAALLAQYPVKREDFVLGPVPEIVDADAGIRDSDQAPTGDDPSSSLAVGVEVQPAWSPRRPFVDTTNHQSGLQRSPRGIGRGGSKVQDGNSYRSDGALPVPSHSIFPGNVFPRVDMSGEASSSSVVGLAAQQNNNYRHGIAASHANTVADEGDGPSKKVTGRARKERTSVRQRSSASRTALATPVAAVASSQHPANWCAECSVVIPGGACNFKAHVKRKHERPAALPCPLCNEEFSAHRGAEFFSFHLFGTRRWTQCRVVKEAYGVAGRRDRVEVNADNIDVLGNWIVQHRQDIVNAQFTYAVQWPTRSTISRMLRRWDERSRAASGTGSNAEA